MRSLAAPGKRCCQKGGRHVGGWGGVCWGYIEREARPVGYFRPFRVFLGGDLLGILGIFNRFGALLMGILGGRLVGYFKRFGVLSKGTLGGRPFMVLGYFGKEICWEFRVFRVFSGLGVLLRVFWERHLLVLWGI